MFMCSESQYKRQFGVWKLKKNIPTPKKIAIYETIHTRAQMGKSSLVKYKGQNVDPGKLRRLLKTKRRQEIKITSANIVQDVYDKSFLSLYFYLRNFAPTHEKTRGKTVKMIVFT